MPFAGQKMICMALLVGIALYAILAGVILKSNAGIGILDEPIESLDTAAVVVGIAQTLAAVTLRFLFNKKADAADLADRTTPRLLSRLVPIFILQTACLFAITVWLLNGKAVPALAVACILLSISIALMPLQDPDADRA